jgi:hypothetical protein
MKYIAGNKVTYIGNIAFDDNRRLFENVVGTVTGYWRPEHYRRNNLEYIVMCNWVTKNGVHFQWNVPESYTKRLR